MEVNKFNSTILYHLPRETMFYYCPDGKPDMKLGKVKFVKLDGMYSVCIDREGNIIHFSASTPVIIAD